MKEAQLVSMKKRIEGLTNVVKKLFQEVQANATFAQGILTALQLHLGEEEWNKLDEQTKFYRTYEDPFKHPHIRFYKPQVEEEEEETE